MYPIQTDEPFGGAVRSMTGYGRAQQLIEGREIAVELRSVNHRYFEYSARVPRSYAYLEERLKLMVKGACSRGKLDVSLSIQVQEGSNAKVKLNHNLAKEYLNALKDLAEELEVKNDIAVSHLAQYNDIFIVTKAEDDEDKVWDGVEQVAREAVQRFISMRETEGARMAQDLLERLGCIEQLVEQIKLLSPKTVEAYRAKLTAKLQDILHDSSVDEQRILTEAAIFSEKIAIAEETVRLESHIHQFRQILCSKEPVGRKLDFLVQEFNREANTIGSKAQDLEIGKLVVEMKSEIEKIREQIQNIE